MNGIAIVEEMATVTTDDETETETENENENETTVTQDAEMSMHDTEEGDQIVGTSIAGAMIGEDGGRVPDLAHRLEAATKAGHETDMTAMIGADEFVRGRGLDHDHRRRHRQSTLTKRQK